MECDICMEPMDAAERRPKILPCGHTFCLLCLNAQGSQTCAVDRKVFQGAVADLPDNYIVLKTFEKKTSPRLLRLWCRDCAKEATERCGDEHRICSLRKIRAETTQPRLDALRRGEESLEALGDLLARSAPDKLLGHALEDCVDYLRCHKADMADKRRRLQAAQGKGQAAWEKEFEAAEPSVLSQRAGAMVTTLTGVSASSCSVALRGGGVTWRGSVDPSEDAVAMLLLCVMLIDGKLEAEEPPATLGAEQEAAEAPCWQERSNQAQSLTVEEMAARMRVDARVARGRDWPPIWMFDGSPPDSDTGTVTKVFDDGDVHVKWDSGVGSYYSMGRDGVYQLQLLGTPTPFSDYTLFRRFCGVWTDPRMRTLERVESPTVEVLGLISPTEQHLEAVRAMPKLREVHVRLPSATQQQLQAVLQTPKLVGLEVHCPFEAPLPPPSAPLPVVGLKWLRVGVYPLVTALALVRANADTLELLELVAASTVPYGCPDLAGELRRCGPKRLQRLVLLRGSDSCVCRHDERTCRGQVVDVENELKKVTVACKVFCSECSR